MLFFCCNGMGVIKDDKIHLFFNGLYLTINNRLRACLKIHSRHLHAPLSGIFAPNSGYVARYAPFIRDKSPTKCDAQLPESNFKTRS